MIQAKCVILTFDKNNQFIKKSHILAWEIFLMLRKKVVKRDYLNKKLEEYNYFLSNQHNLH